MRLFAALLHDEQVVIAQIAVPEDTTETTQVANLLQDVDLTGKTVTADAAHTNVDTADYLAGQRNADYVLPVKGNTPTLLDAIIAKMPPPLRWQRPPHPRPNRRRPPHHARNLGS